MMAAALAVLVGSGVLLMLCDGAVLTVIGVAGVTIALPCRYDAVAHGAMDVCWGTRLSLTGCENTLIATAGGSLAYRASSRYHIPVDFHRGNVALLISAPQESDSGFYVCRVEVPGMFNDLSHTVHLIITKAPRTPTPRPERRILRPEQRRTTSLLTTPGTEPTASPPKTSTAPLTFSVKTTADLTVEVMENQVSSNAASEDPHSLTLMAFMMNTLRVAAAMFIPGLAFTFIFKLRRSKGSDPVSRQLGHQMQNVRPVDHRPVAIPPHWEAFMPH